RGPRPFPQSSTHHPKSDRFPQLPGECGSGKISPEPGPLGRTEMGGTNMTSVANPIPPQDFSGIVGHRFIYTYANGWQYEMYVKNATTIDYRIHSGHVGGRWVKGQEVNLVQLDDDSYKISWKKKKNKPVSNQLLHYKTHIEE
ncbi:phenolic acid decarboxylase, partial [Streptococcus pyogenes]|uniref:phenolic acid decarboxylase n=1 Tax=Streptococcus pyogenes TaxID=1314 RepID=UPI003F689889